MSVQTGATLAVRPLLPARQAPFDGLGHGDGAATVKR
jgi:hypothetical protein